MRWVLLLVACSSQAEMSGVDEFLGTWQFASGSDNIVCPTGTTAQALTGTLTITRQGEGILVTDAAACNFTYSVSGHRAVLGADKSCSFAVPQLGQGATADVTYDMITLETSDGMSMSDVFSGKVRYTTAAGSQDCAFSGSATLSKVGR